MAQRTSSETGAADGKRREDEPAPLQAGVSLDATHLGAALERGSDVMGWYEVHPEAFLQEVAGVAPIAGAPAMAQLEALQAQKPVSMHGVEMGFGSERGLDPRHIKSLKSLFERVPPCLFSEHLAWSSHTPLEDYATLPPPYDEATLERVVRHIDQTQQELGRKVLLENPVQHIRLINSTLSETEFLAEAVARTGCGLLLDVNHVFISAANSRATAEEYLSAFPVEAIGEIHLGGHTEALDVEGRAVLQDSAETPEEIWALYERLINRIGPRPTLIEWDGPALDWSRLENEASRVNQLLARAAASAPLAS